MQLISLTAWGYAAACALWGVRRGKISERTLGRCAFFLLALSMSLTAALVFASGLDALRTLLPLHLCSAGAALCLFFYIRPARCVFHFLYYVALPGAALALCFPAVAVSRHQDAMDAAFFLTHALVVFAPVLRIACGEKPDVRAALPCYGALAAFSLLVFAVDHLLDANYLFLLSAPAGTPLALLWRLGKGGYYAALALLALLIVLFQRSIAAVLARFAPPARVTLKAPR